MWDILCLILAVILAFGAGKLASLAKMPAVLGVLLSGMILGPNALNLLNQRILDAADYKILISVLECCMGLMLGSEMIWKKMRSYGKQILVITFAQSLVTFGVVSLAFSVIFHFMRIPVFLGLIFGGIAMATAPAPALSIISEYKTDGPVTRTLIPLAVIDDVIAICTFISVMGVVLHHTSNGSIPGYLILLIVAFPFFIGILVGWPLSLVLKKIPSGKNRAAVLLGGIILTAGLTMAANVCLMPLPVLNYMMSGMVYSAVLANCTEEKVFQETMKYCNPIVGACFTVIILNLGAPLDYHLILGAGVFTAVYILARAVGKIGGAALGAGLSHGAPTVKKYLGMTLLPHSGVSLVLTGIAISALTGPYSQYGDIVRGTIAAAAVINEIIAVFVARWGFTLAGEMGKAAHQY